MDRVKDCVYCNIKYGVRRQTTRQCRKCEAPVCTFVRNCFEKFRKESFKEERIKWLTNKSVPKGTRVHTGRPKGSTIQRGRGKRKRKNW